MLGRFSVAVWALLVGAALAASPDEPKQGSKPAEGGAKTEPESKPQSEPERETEPEPKPQSEPEPESKPQSEPEPESKPQSEPEPKSKPERETEPDSEPAPNPQPLSPFDSLIARLSAQYPGRDDVQQATAAILEAVGLFLVEHPDDPETGSARALLAEVVALAGESNASRAEWAKLAENAPRPADRARALFLLGTDYFLRGKRDDATEAFGRLTSTYPESPWTKASESTRDYLALSAKNAFPPAPSFDTEFFDPTYLQAVVTANLERSSSRTDGDPAGPVESKKSTRPENLKPKTNRFSSKSLRGKVVLIYFWRQASQDIATFVDTVARHPKASLDRALKDYPILKNQIVVLGVNLDRSEAVFHAANARLKAPWPQLHDGKGFGTPLAQSFRIPRAPHWAVIGPRGRVWYLGGHLETFYAYASEAMKRHRIALEKKSGRRG